MFSHLDWPVSVYFPSSDLSVNSLVADATIFYEGKNIIWKYPKRENIKLFELEKGKACKWTFYRLQKAKKKKNVPKSTKKHRVFPESPGEDDGRESFLNILTQASHRRYSQRCFVGKITSFVLDSTILMLWGEGTLNSTLRKSRENILTLPGALMEMQIEEKTIQKFFLLWLKP